MRRDPVHGSLAALLSLEVLVGVLAVTALPEQVSARPDIEKKADIEEKAAPKRGAHWVSLAEGLAMARAARRPILVWYDARKEGEGDDEFAEMLRHSTFKSTLARYALIRLDDGDLADAYSAPPTGPRVPVRKAKKKVRKGKDAEAVKPPADGDAETVGQRLRVLSGPSALIVLDFRERVIERYEKELPKRTRLRARLKKIQKTNTFFVARSFPVEKALVESRTAYKVGNARLAVLKVRELEAPKVRNQLDPVLQGWVAERIKVYRDRARSLLGEAATFENEGDKRKADSSVKYSKALEAFQKVAKSYPFKDIVIKANRRQGEILRKMSLTGQSPFGR